MPEFALIVLYSRSDVLLCGCLFWDSEESTTSDVTLVPALVGVLHILDELVEVVVGEFVLGRLEHLVVEVVAEGRLARHEPQVLHVILVTRVNDRIVFIVCVDDLVVWLAGEGLEEELDEALAGGAVRRALGLAIEAEPRAEEATLTGVVHFEVAGRVKVRVGGLRARPAVWLERLARRMVNLVPRAHISVGFEDER